MSVFELTVNVSVKHLNTSRFDYEYSNLLSELKSISSPENPMVISDENFVNIFEKMDKNFNKLNEFKNKMESVKSKNENIKKLIKEIKIVIERLKNFSNYKEIQLVFDYIDDDIGAISVIYIIN